MTLMKKKKLITSKTTNNVALSNLRKSIHYLQQAIREKDLRNDRDLLKALDIMAKKETENVDVNDPNHYNTTEI